MDAIIHTIHAIKRELDIKSPYMFEFDLKNKKMVKNRQYLRTSRGGGARLKRMM